MKSVRLKLFLNIKHEDGPDSRFGFILERSINFDFIPQIGSELSLKLTNISEYDEFTVLGVTHKLNQEFKYANSHIVAEKNYLTKDFLDVINEIKNEILYDTLNPRDFTDAEMMKFPGYTKVEFEKSINLFGKRCIDEGWLMEFVMNMKRHKKRSDE